MLWYRLVGQVFVPESQPICSGLAHVFAELMHMYCALAAVWWMGWLQATPVALIKLTC